jgi:hypothetical protein
MRRLLTASRTGLCVTAAVALLAGCGGGSDDDTSSSATSTTSSSAEASDTAGADPANAAFCDSARKLLGTLVPAVTGTDDPATLAPALAQAKADAEAVEPPEEIATDWAALRDGLDQFAQAAAAVVPNDTASAAQFLQTKTQLVAQLAGSATTVQTFLAQECGLTTGSAAPTS